MEALLTQNLSQKQLGQSHFGQSQAIALLPGLPEKPRELVPFPFQAEMVKQLYGHIRSNQKQILMIAPTGSGKTYIASLVLKGATVKAKKPIRCVFLVDLNCLIDQTVKELEGLGVECAVLQGVRSRTKKARRQLEKCRVIVASVQTITARMKKQPLREILGDVGLFFEDECHNTSQSRLADAIRETYTTGTLFIGLTATPWLPGAKAWLGQKYDVKVIAPAVSELIQLGRVVPAQTFSVGGVLDVQDLDIDNRTGDFSETAMASQIGKKASLDKIVSEWTRLSEGRSTIAYCPKVATAKQLAEAFNAAEIAAEWQCGKTPLGQDGKTEHEAGILTRAAQNYRLEMGITKVVCSVGTQTKGFNLKSLGCIMLVRATNVASLFFQMVGRGSRTCDRAVWALDEWGNPWGRKQNYLLLDFGGNLERFSPLSPNTLGEVPERDYYIGKPKRRRDSNENYKYCPECDKDNERSLSFFTKICPECGYEFNSDSDGDQEEQLDFGFEIELKEWFDERSAYQAGWTRSRRRACYNQNLSPDIAAEEFHQKFGFVAPNSWYVNAVLNPRVLGHEVRDRDVEEFIDYLIQHQPSNAARAKLWFNHHWRLEFGAEFDPKQYRKRRVKPIQDESGWWTTLGVNKRCSISDLKSVYRKLSRLYHPDHVGIESEERMKELNSAYDEGKKFLSGY